MDNKNCIISCVNAGLGYDNKAIIKDFNFEVFEGDYICVVGENGSGKSTLIKTILGLVKPVEGTVELHQSLKSGAIGYLPQQTQVQKHFPASVMEVVLSGFLNGMNGRPFFRAKEKKQALRNLDRMEILDLKNRCYGELSGGQQQRVAIARAMANDPSIILADEPTGALDSQTGRMVMDIFHELHDKHGKTIVLITHSPELAEECERIITIKDGEIIGERKGGGRNASD